MKARNYREVKGQPYTRKKYIRGSPSSKIVKFTMGNTAGDYEYQARLIADKSVQIRHNALDKAIGLAARVKPDQALIMVNINKDGLDAATLALKRGSAKLPTPCRVVVEKLGD
ncbi:MAG: hypothetical protein P8X47_13690 [Ignavibacteriaceae bacterium]